MSQPKPEEIMMHSERFVRLLETRGEEEQDAGYTAFLAENDLADICKRTGLSDESVMKLVLESSVSDIESRNYAVILHVLHEYAFDCFEKVVDELNRENTRLAKVFQLKDLDDNETVRDIVSHTCICESNKCGNYLTALEREHLLCMKVVVPDRLFGCPLKQEISIPNMVCADFIKCIKWLINHAGYAGFILYSAARANNLQILQVVATECFPKPQLHAYPVGSLKAETLLYLFEQNMLRPGFIGGITSVETFRAVYKIIVGAEVPTDLNVNMFVEEKDDEMISFLLDNGAPPTSELLTYALQTRNAKFLDECGELCISLEDYMSTSRFFRENPPDSEQTRELKSSLGRVKFNYRAILKGLSSERVKQLFNSDRLILRELYENVKKLNVKAVIYLSSIFGDTDVTLRIVDEIRYNDGKDDDEDEDEDD